MTPAPGPVRTVGGHLERIRGRYAATRCERNVGALLRWHRGDAGLTQEALAERASLSRRGIADLERGARLAPYSATVERLATALDLSDSERACFAAAARRRPGARAVLAPVVNGAEPKRRHNLPAHRVRMIGREHDMAAARHILLHAEGRLLTLTGAGGSGKTRPAPKVRISPSLTVSSIPPDSTSYELTPWRGMPVLVKPRLAVRT